VPSLVDGGAYWFVDLTVADPIYALPAASTAVFLLMVELNAADGMEGHDPAMVSRMKWGMRAVAFVMPVIAGSMPAVRLRAAPVPRVGMICDQLCGVQNASAGARRLRAVPYVRRVCVRTIPTGLQPACMRALRPRRRPAHALGALPAGGAAA
jgi:hypothetical protein